MGKLANPCKNKKLSADGKRIPCPLSEMLSRLGDKWSVLIIVALAEAPNHKFRFSELKKNVEGISQRMLTATLRNLERDGVLTRHLYPEIPPRVEYELTSLGQSILEPLQSFVEWIEGNWSEIHKARETFDLGHKPNLRSKAAKKSLPPTALDVGHVMTSVPRTTTTAAPALKTATTAAPVPTLPGSAMDVRRR